MSTKDFKYTPAEEPKDSVYDFSVINGNGEEVSMETFRSKALVIVNISSKDPEAMGYLKKLYMINGSFRHRGLKILTFPCGQFGEKETYEDSIAFVKDMNMDIGEIFAPIQANGSQTPKLFQYMKKKSPGERGSFIGHNFTVFVVDDLGQVVARLTPPYASDYFKDVVDSTLKEREKYESMASTIPPVVN